MGGAPGLSSFGDRLQLVVPEQPSAPVLQPDFEDEVFRGSPGVGPLSADRARKSLQLGGKPRSPAHPDPRADAYPFRHHASRHASSLVIGTKPSKARVPSPRRLPRSTRDRRPRNRRRGCTRSPRPVLGRARGWGVLASDASSPPRLAPGRPEPPGALGSGIAGLAYARLLLPLSQRVWPKRCRDPTPYCVAVQPSTCSGAYGGRGPSAKTVTYLVQAYEEQTDGREPQQEWTDQGPARRRSHHVPPGPVRHPRLLRWHGGHSRGPQRRRSPRTRPRSLPRRGHHAGAAALPEGH